MNRSEFLKVAFGSVLTLKALQSSAFAGSFQAEGPFKLAPLPFDSGALEPHIDKQTMEIHHGKHHKAYVDNLNKAVAGSAMASMSIDDLVKKIDSSTPAAIRNNGGGHWNHTFFWNILGANGGKQPSGNLAEAITKKYGSFDKFKEEWAKAATGRFGSGWAWLIVNGQNIDIVSTPNQDNPLMVLAEKKGTPILGLDVWEHAYYLKYQNRRPDYIAAFWNVVNWAKVNELYNAAMKA
ncbi:superoxide dismutase [Larkinella punicea]|uniref:Superoxide dismutase n=1 Tax=Larkinella punicea TaxID=2315727 RepID=A0A368JIB1_9BACT|nr:superoxide dismutase [Larkinella punicea]RCR65841.1 superoxide dismutase [Larkinella punicea]